MPILNTNPTARQFADAWGAEFKRAIASVGSSRTLTRAAAETIGSSDPSLVVYRDNALNWFDANQRERVSKPKLAAAGRRYALSEAKKLAGTRGRISLDKSSQLPADLRSDYRVLRGLDVTPEGAQLASITAALAGPVAALGEWWESGDNGVNVTVNALAGLTTIDEALAAAPAQAPWTSSEGALSLSPAQGVQALEAFSSSARAALEGFMDGPRPEVQAFLQAVSGAFQGSSELRVAHGQDLGGTYLFGRASDGYALVVAQPYSG